MKPNPTDSWFVKKLIAMEACDLMTTNLLFPVYEFRPLPTDLERQDVRRYANGQWIADDGEYDLAFAVTGFGAPMVYYVELPYQRNIRWSWLSQHWSGVDYNHPRGNPWHYMLREGATKWGGSWQRDQHPNRIAGEAGMRMVSKERSCANGRGARFELNDRYIKAGLVRERDGRQVVVPPIDPLCMYCGLKWKSAAASPSLASPQH